MGQAVELETEYSCAHSEPTSSTVQTKLMELAQLQKTSVQTWRSRREALQVRAQPQRHSRAQTGMKKPYLLLKTSLEAQGASTTETSDTPKTHARALKLWWRALAPSMLR